MKKSQDLKRGYNAVELSIRGKKIRVPNAPNGMLKSLVTTQKLSLVHSVLKSNTCFQLFATYKVKDESCKDKFPPDTFSSPIFLRSFPKLHCDSVTQ
ncbi:unnamed protein product [Calypogeia fissa]